MTEQPCHVGCYAFATGRKVVSHMENTVGPGDPRRRCLCDWGVLNEYGLPYGPVPALSDPRWLADVVTGLADRTTRGNNWSITFSRFGKGYHALIHGASPAPVRGFGPDIPSALCAAIKAARGAK